MANPEKVILKIVSVKGTCAAGHRVGQEFDLSKDFLLGVSGDPRAICPLCISCNLSLMASPPARRGIPVGRGPG